MECMLFRLPRIWRRTQHPLDVPGLSGDRQQIGEGAHGPGIEQRRSHRYLDSEPARMASTDDGGGKIGCPLASHAWIVSLTRSSSSSSRS